MITYVNDYIKSSIQIVGRQTKFMVALWTRDYIPIVGNQVEKDFYYHHLRAVAGMGFINRVVIKVSKKDQKRSANIPNIFDLIPKEVFLKKDPLTGHYSDEWKSYVDWKKVKTIYTVAKMSSPYEVMSSNKSKGRKKAEATHFLCMNNIPFAILVRQGGGFDKEYYHEPIEIIDDRILPSPTNTGTSRKVHRIISEDEYTPESIKDKLNNTKDEDFIEELRHQYEVWALMLKRMKEMMNTRHPENAGFGSEPPYPNQFYRAVFPLRTHPSDNAFSPLIYHGVVGNSWNSSWQQAYDFQIKAKTLRNNPYEYALSSDPQRLSKIKERQQEMLVHEGHIQSPLDLIRVSIRTLIWKGELTVNTINHALQVLNELSFNEYKRQMGVVGVINYLTMTDVPIFTISDAFTIMHPLPTEKSFEDYKTLPSIRMWAKHFIKRVLSPKRPNMIEDYPPNTSKFVQTKIKVIDGEDEFVAFQAIDTPPDFESKYWAGMLLNPSMRIKIDDKSWAFDYDAITDYKPHKHWNNSEYRDLVEYAMPYPKPMKYESYEKGRAGFERGVLPPLVS